MILVIYSKFDIYVINPDGIDLQNLTNTPDFEERAPSWSPDGKRIVFSSKCSGQWDICVMDASGKNMARPTQTSEDEFDPICSPLLPMVIALDRKMTITWGKIK